MYRCQFCRKVKTLAEGIVTTWGGNVLFGLCPECHPGRPIVIKTQATSDGSPGVFVGFADEADRPAAPEVIAVSSMSEAKAFAPAIAKRELTEWGDDQ